MEKINDINLLEAIKRISDLYNQARVIDQQVGVAVNILCSPEMTPDAVTMIMLENLPDLGSIGVPILNEKDSKNVFAVSPFTANSVKLVFAPLTTDPTKNLALHIATVSARLRLLSKAGNDLLRILFTNRFRVMDEFTADKPSVATEHTMRLSTVKRNGSEEIFKKVKELITDLEVLERA